MKEVPSENEPMEMCNIVCEVIKIQPTTIVEIGVKYGGTLNIWRKILPPYPKGTLIAIDSGNTLKFDINQDSRIKFIEGNTLDYRTYKTFASILGDKKVDFLFIDGGHRFIETNSDFYNFGWHVRKGGLIVFHDIYLDSVGDNVGSSKHCWEEIKNRSGRYWEVVCELKHHTGTGIVRIL